MKRIITVILTICMMVSLITIPTIEVSAASTPKAPSKVTLSSAAATSQSQIKLTWKKVKGANGYVVYRNNKYIKTLTAKALTYTDSKLKASTKYSYKVRAYKTYKQTQYYNSKTKKWVTKKPAKKNWKGKKTRKVTKYKYGKWSAVKTATTKAAIKTVLVAPTIRLSGNATIETGDKYNLNVKSNSTGAISYTSSNSTVATVSNGIVTAKSAGTATITISQAAKGNYKAGSSKVTIKVVKDLNFINSTLPTAETYNISKGSVTYTVKSKSGATFTSSNESIATTSKGVASAISNTITFKKAGTVTITVTSKADPSLKKTIKLTITDNNSSSSSSNNSSNSNNNSSNNSNTNSNTGNNNNNNTSNAVAYKAFKVLESTSVINIRDNGTVKVQLPANNFTVTWSSSDNDCISVQGSGNTATLSAKKKYGESIKITAKLNVPSGSTYTGKTEVSIYVNNTVYPVDSDGKYALTKNARKQLYCGGVQANIAEIVNVLPSGVTFKVNIGEIDGFAW